MATEPENQVLTPSPEDVLTDRERVALLAYRKTVQLRLSAESQMKLFALFLAGHPCAEIHALNKQFSLGQILTARIEGTWDARRREHMEALYANVLSRIQQTSVESVGFVADQMTAIHKHYGEKARKYIQSGDPKDFDNFGVDGIRSYKLMIESWQKLTGQEKSASEGGIASPPARIEREVTTSAARPVQAAPSNANEIVKAALAKRKEQQGKK